MGISMQRSEARQPWPHTKRAGAPSLATPVCLAALLIAAQVLLAPLCSAGVSHNLAAFSVALKYTPVLDEYPCHSCENNEFQDTGGKSMWRA